MTKTIGDKSLEANNPHWVEWVTGLVSAVIVLVVIFWIAKDAFKDQDTSPDLTATVVITEQRSNGFQVSFEVSNVASATASQVAVNGEIRDGSGIVERASTVLDYVPGRSKAGGGLIFRNDPRGRIILYVSAFNEP
ncbi:uncharacterized protein (TIGR02588 family) [Rhizobium skierniewicense]|uniref:Uncharacterized protein (TIGR02588 family) n=1 Tax=Rhizobium skierniewicense TaxID=984260 RepID=A0A7W6C917_9HYPH|nr:TIGR02588 family protein [Rhizobium skierniewicense]MBB3947021.1 uncharacterized protein (TIGR02588 family) [Rhizobium skierniewicense]